MIRARAYGMTATYAVIARQFSPCEKPARTVKAAGMTAVLALFAFEGGRHERTNHRKI